MTDANTPESTPHDYEPSEFYRANYTDPICRICGQSPRYHLHN